MRVWRVLAVFALLAPGAAEAETFSGIWSQENWEGIKPIDGGKCVIAHTSERRYDLQPRPGSPNELYGNFVVIDWFLPLAANAPCNLNGMPLQGVGMRARVWLLEGYRDGNYARLSGKWDHCLGIGCDDPELYRQPFTTGLTLEDGGLIDRDEGPESLSWSFHRVAWHNERVAGALAAYEAMVVTFMTGEVSSIRGIYASRQIPPGRVEAKIADLPLIRNAMEPVVSRSSIVSRVVDTLPAQRALGIDRLAVLLLQANLADGTKREEIAILQSEAGQWRLLP